MPVELPVRDKPIRLRPPLDGVAQLLLDPLQSQQHGLHVVATRARLGVAARLRVRQDDGQLVVLFFLAVVGVALRRRPIFVMWVAYQHQREPVVGLVAVAPIFRFRGATGRAGLFLLLPGAADKTFRQDSGVKTYRIDAYTTVAKDRMDASRIYFAAMWKILRWGSFWCSVAYVADNPTVSSFLSYKLNLFARCSLHIVETYSIVELAAARREQDEILS